MRMSTTRTSKRQFDQGFTLIELLIVVAILGIVAALITPSLGAERRVALGTEADRLGRAVELARIDAVNASRQWGLRVSKDSYVFEHFDIEDNSWQNSAGNPFSQYELPDGFELRTSVESRTLTFRAGRKSPPILILSSGELTPFSIELSSNYSAGTCVVSSDGLARTQTTCGA